MTGREEYRGQGAGESLVLLNELSGKLTLRRKHLKRDLKEMKKSRRRFLEGEHSRWGGEQVQKPPGRPLPHTSEKEPR